MSQPSTAGGRPPAPPGPVVPRDRSPVNWLLLVPVVLALAVPLYDSREPRLAGIPFFYWFQLAVIPVGVACTTLVYLAGRRRPVRDDARDDVRRPDVTPDDGQDLR